MWEETIPPPWFTCEKKQFHHPGSHVRRNNFTTLVHMWEETIPPLDKTLCDKVCQWFSTGPPVSSTNKTDLHDITEILLVLRTIKQTYQYRYQMHWDGKILPNCPYKVEATFSLQEGWSYKRGTIVLLDFLWLLLESIWISYLIILQLCSMFTVHIRDMWNVGKKDHVIQKCVFRLVYLSPFLRWKSGITGHHLAPVVRRL
jgi:hypothetical protein